MVMMEQMGSAGINGRFIRVDGPGCIEPDDVVPTPRSGLDDTDTVSPACRAAGCSTSESATDPGSSASTSNTFITLHSSP